MSKKSSILRIIFIVCTYNTDKSIRGDFMQEFYRKDEIMVERTELDKDTELEFANRNYEFADADLVDYYIYQIKANQAKLDYLIKMAKVKGLNVNFIKDIEYQFLEKDEDVI